MTLRAEFVAMASGRGTAIRELCRRFGISPPTAYKWLHRAEVAGVEGLADRSRRPRVSPGKTPAELERIVVELRDAHPTWGGRKLAARLRALGHADSPSPSTITEILRRHGRLQQTATAPHAWRRFERAVPNELWQMDFKGHVPLGQGHGRLHPLTVLDDHSRYCLVLGACANEQGATVRDLLVAAFRCYGLPDRFLMDNGAPWGATGSQALTRLDVWLLQLGVGVSHGRPLHPQTQGKDERFHRTLKAELLQGPPYRSLREAQGDFDRWRAVYNIERPHEACGLQPPITRYRPSQRPYPEQLPPVEYSPDMLVRRLSANGILTFHARRYWLSEALAGHPVGLRPTARDGVWAIYFGRFHVHTINEHDGTHCRNLVRT
jgi:transposase InsO family protein